ncbi:hypothetical protein CRUP_038212 [Coryphaenoides rupestris]|nr:hypothetical protein CRUP_038212 [Coryphaenoides rupestris]
MPLPVQVFNFQGPVEPMQIDADPQEDQQNAPDINFVVENPTLDLEQYASSYSGFMRIERLQFIAEHCPQLRVEALKMALSFVQRTFNVDSYEEVHRKLAEATREAPGDAEAVAEGAAVPPPLDTAWAESTRKKALLKLEKLDTDLKNYKGNSIKESIRRGHDDLGDHYLDCGDLSNALKCYSRARDYCTSAKHVINMCLNVIKVSVYLQNWSHVLSYVSKAESTPEIAEQRGERDSQNQAVLAKLKCAAGLAELASHKYKAAAKCFLQTSFDHCDFPELLSPSNVAVYGGMCALATFDRQELQRNVISSSSFKLFLELEPQIRDIIFKFYESKYASCLKLLDEMKGPVEPMQIDADPQEDQQNAPDINFVVENPTLDLEQYASSYSGFMRIERLQFIAEHCPQLRVEALKMALSFVQRTFNVDSYEEVHRKLAEATSKRGHDDLGDHYLDCGDLSNALKCYSRARDYCTSAKHVINMCLNVIKVSVYLQNWSHVLSYVSKAESTPEIAEQRGERDSQNQAVLAKLKCAAGLAELASHKYKAAAKCFLQTSFDHCDFPELLSPSNVAVYGGMCALATLTDKSSNATSFKLFLELEPQIRDIIFKFYESKYASCLKLLDEMKYFSPYASADMTKMAQAFNTTILYARDVDQRSTTFEKSLIMGKDQTRMSTNM